MKNKLRKRLAALALCGVMVFSGSSSALADSPAGEIEEAGVVQEVVEDIVEDETAEPVVDEVVETPEVLEEVADTEVQEEVDVIEEPQAQAEEIEEATDEVVSEEIVEEVVDETVSEEVVTEEVEEEPTTEAQPTIAEKVTEVAEKVAEVVEKVIKYIIGMHDDLTYEDDQVIIKVYAEKDEIIPEGTKIKVVPILADDEETKEKYEEVATGLQEKAAEDEQIIEGFLAYDITLVDSEGNEFEPNGEVKVSMEYKEAALPAEIENVEEAEVTIHHFEEDENGEVKEIVDMIAEEAIEAAVEVTEAVEVEKVEFVTTSFSTFTITWSSGTRSAEITVHYVDEKGNELTGSQTNDVRLSSSWLNLSNYATDIDGYVFSKIELDEQGSDRTATYIRVYNNTLQYSERNNGNSGTTWEAISSNEQTEKDIYIVYVKDISVNVTILNARGAQISTENIQLEEDIPYELSGMENITNGGYTYTYDSAYVETSAGEKVDVTSVIYQNEKYYYIKADGTTVEFTEGHTLYLKYSGGPETITTVDSIANHVNIHLTDYSRWASESRANEVIYNINNGHGLQFYTSGSTSAEPSYNAYTNGNSPRQGFLRGYLEADYPYLKAAENNSAESLEYLFNDSTKTYTANYLFKKDGGYYVYDSATNFAELDIATGNFTVYNDDKNGFFPFNKYTDDVQTNAASQNAVTNHHFGMHVDFNFMQPKGGLDKEVPMIFEFSGDDDVWVFIDGMLVLDLGGIHQPTGGTINFATGEVTYTHAENTTIREMYINALKEQGFNEADATEKADSYFVQYTENGKTYYRFKDYSQHTLNFFYLERGAHDTNCKIKFNLISIPENTISIEKEITESNMIDFADAEFTFKIEKKDVNTADGSYPTTSAVLANAEYNLYAVEGNNKTLIETRTTDENGQFVLRHGQRAEFSNIPASTKYCVTEVAIHSDVYDQVNFNETVIKNDNNQEIGNFSTGDLLAQDCVYVKFQNRCNAANFRNLVINKVLAAGETTDEFAIKVEFKQENRWVAYNGTYRLNSSTGTQKTAEEGGIIRLKAGESAYIIGLISGTEYRVTEQLNEQQAPNYKAPVYDGTGIATKTDITGEIEIGKVTDEANNRNHIVTITNTLLTKTVNVEKVWVDSNANHETVYAGLYSVVAGVSTPVEMKQLELINNKYEASFTNLGITTQYEVKELVPVSSGETVDFTLNGVGYRAIKADEYYTTETDYYTVSYSTEENGNTMNVTITNTALNKVVVEKVWNDADNAYGTRPTKLNVTIKNDSDEVIITLNGNTQNQGSIVFGNNAFPVKYTPWKATIYGLDITAYEFTEDEKDTIGYNSNGAVVDTVAGTVTFTNTINVHIVKTNVGAKLHLGGAVFELTDGITSYYGESSEDNGYLQWYKDYASGVLSNPVSPEDGTYTLSEVKAPAGYAVSEEEWTIQVIDGVFVVMDITTNKPIQLEGLMTLYQNGDKTTYVYEVTYENEALYELPSTGGLGIYVPMMSGVIMMMAAALVLMNNKRREVLER